MKTYSQFLRTQSRAIELVFAVIALAGLLAYFNLPSNVYPELAFPRIAVIAHVGDMSPQRVVVTATRPLEQALGQVYNVRWVRSKTIRGATELSVEFQEGADMERALQQAQARIAEIRSSLPQGSRLIVERVTPAIFPVITYNLSSETITQADLNYIANFQIQPALTRVPGVARCDVQGGDIEEVAVQIDPLRIQMIGISIADVISAINKSNQPQVVGVQNRDYQQNLVVAGGQAHTPEQLKGVVVATTKTGLPIFLSDIASVDWGVADKTQIVSASGKQGVALNIYRQPNSNVVAVSQGVSHEIQKLKSLLLPGLNLAPAYNESYLVSEAINSVRDAILTGIVLIVVVLFLFLRDWRSTVIAAFTIPLSALSAFGIMYLLHQSLNLMSLGGMAVAIGLVIDDAVVLIENIDHQLSRGLSPVTAVQQALTELVAPVISSTVTTVVVFAPLGLLSGVAGQFFTGFTITLAAAVVFSLLLSLTLTPLLASRWLKPRAASAAASGIGRLQSGYRCLMQSVFARPLLIVLSALLLVFIGTILGTSLGSDFLPAVDEGSYMFDYLTPPGSNIWETNYVATRLEKILAKTPEVVGWTRRSGAENGLYATATNKGDIEVVLKPYNQRHRTVWQIMDEQRAFAAALVPEADTDFHQILQDQLNDLQGIADDLEIKVFGHDRATLGKLAQEIDDRLQKVSGLTDLHVTGKVGAPQSDVIIDEKQAERIGLTTADVLDQLRDSLLGATATQVRQGDRLIDVRARLNDSFRFDPEKLKTLPIIGKTGLVAPLNSLASIEETAGEGEIRRENQLEYVSVDGNIEGRDLGSAINDIKAQLRSLVLPGGYTLDLGGNYRSQQTAFAQLLQILALGIVLVYVVLLIQFRSWLQPLTIFTAIPLSLFGVVLALKLTGTTLNVSSFMGVILLVGLVVKNGIILIDYTNHILARGSSLEEALLEAGSARLRPILMTTLCTLLGLLPLALGAGAGSELQKPLAIAVIGGLSLSTFFTLVLMPVTYRALARLARAKQAS